MPITVLEKMQPDTVPQTVHVLLPKMLRQVPLRSSWILRQQGRLPLLQQLEDQEWRTQMPLNAFFPVIPTWIHLDLISIVGCIYH